MAPRFLSCPCSASLQNPYTPVRFRPAPPSIHALAAVFPMSAMRFDANAPSAMNQRAMSHRVTEHRATDRRAKDHDGTRWCNGAGCIPNEND